MPLQSRRSSHQSPICLHHVVPSPFSRTSNNLRTAMRHHLSSKTTSPWTLHAVPHTPSPCTIGASSTNPRTNFRTGYAHHRRPPRPFTHINEFINVHCHHLGVTPSTLPTSPRAQPHHTFSPFRIVVSPLRHLTQHLR